jgi:hypothetical protein
VHSCGKYRVLLMWVAVMALVVGAVAQDGCMSATRSAGPVQIDLSPPGNFIDVCAEDATLCRTLTSGYPPSVSTLAYFVPAEEWKTAKEKPQGFSRYLIAQLAGSMSPEKLPGFKRYLHSQQGEIPDSTSLPSFLAAHGRVPLGIVGESADSISFGTVMKLESTQPSSQSLALASINSAIIVRDRVLSLYAFDTVKNPSAVEPLKALSEKWLTCLRQNNHSAK